MENSSRPAARALAILHMDDEPAMREITSLLLGHRGHRVVSCSDVDETVASYREHLERGSRFDLVILDLSIPGQKGGVEGMREIRAIDPEARIVACSGAAPSEPLDPGFVGFVGKPFLPGSLDELTALVSAPPGAR